jgi:RNA polymerase sigma-70 factor (ECF subfamily)
MPMKEALRDLVRAAASGEEAAVAELYDLVAPRLYALALWRTGNRADAEEVVQDLFVRLVERPVRLDEVRRPMTWLLTATHRLAIDVTRRRSTRATAVLEADAALVVPAHDPTLALDAARAGRLLARLPAKQRTVLYLRHYEGLSLTEIATVVRAPLFTVASRYRLGLAKLRRAIGEGS